MEAYISEIFNSIQGEGPYAGVRQVFVRFCRCQLHCAYCDTPETGSNVEVCRIERTPGKGDFYSIDNPISRDDVVEIIGNLWTPSTRHISLTGGEPLIHADFIRALGPVHPLYLETNSGLPEQARKLKDMLAVASCDIKLPEHNSTRDYKELLKNELETISILSRTSQTFVKVVVLPETTECSISAAVDGVASIDRNIPLILQPVTSDIPVPSGLLLRLMDFAGEKLKDVRAIPQMHKMMGLL